MMTGAVRGQEWAYMQWAGCVNELRGARLYVSWLEGAGRGGTSELAAARLRVVMLEASVRYLQRSL